MNNSIMKLLSLMMLAITLSSCVSVKVIIPPIYGLNSGYSKLTDKEKKMVIFAQDNTDILQDTLR